MWGAHMPPAGRRLPDESRTLKTARKRIEDHYQWQKIAEDIEGAYLEVLRKGPTTVLEKKPSNTAAITSEDLPLRRRAG